MIAAKSRHLPDQSNQLYLSTQLDGPSRRYPNSSLQLSFHLIFHLRRRLHPQLIALRQSLFGCITSPSVSQSARILSRASLSHLPAWLWLLFSASITRTRLQRGELPLYSPLLYYLLY